MTLRRGSRFYRSELARMIEQFRKGDIVVPTFFANPASGLRGVVTDINIPCNKVYVAWNGGAVKQHDPEEVMLAVKPVEIRKNELDQLEDAVENNPVPEDKSAEGDLMSLKARRMTNIKKASKWYAHNRSHSGSISLGNFPTEEAATTELFNQVVGVKRTGWMYDDVEELQKDIDAGEVYVSNSNIAGDCNESLVPRRMAKKKIKIAGFNPDNYIKKLNDIKSVAEKEKEDKGSGDESGQYLQDVKTILKTLERQRINVVRGLSSYVATRFKNIRKLLNEALKWERKYPGEVDPYLMVQLTDGLIDLFEHFKEEDQKMIQQLNPDLTDGEAFWNWLTSQKLDKLYKFFVAIGWPEGFTYCRQSKKYCVNTGYPSIKKLLDKSGIKLSSVKIADNVIRLADFVGDPNEIPPKEAEFIGDPETHGINEPIDGGFNIMQKLVKDLKKEQGYNNVEDMIEDEVKLALYHGQPGRVYRRTRAEKETNDLVCPKCKANLEQEPFTKSSKLYKCKKCGWKIPSDKLAIELKPRRMKKALDDNFDEEFPGDYIMKMSYSIVTPESAEEGDYAENGWEIEKEEYESLEELLNAANSQASWVEWSSSNPDGKHDWVVSEEQQDYRTGESTEYNLFIERKDKKPLSKEEIEYINKKLRIR